MYIFLPYILSMIASLVQCKAGEGAGLKGSPNCQCAWRWTPGNHCLFSSSSRNSSRDALWGSEDKVPGAYIFFGGGVISVQLTYLSIWLQFSANSSICLWLWHEHWQDGLEEKEASMYSESQPLHWLMNLQTVASLLILQLCTWNYLVLRIITLLCFAST